MKFYCENFKCAALKMYNNCKSINIVCDCFGISIKTLYNWRHNKTFKTTKKQNIISYKYSNDVIEYIKKYIINRCNFKMKNLIKLLYKNFKKTYTSYNIYYILKKLNITYKKARKIIRINKNQHNKKVKDFVKKVNEIGHNKIISIDESHFYLNMKSNKGWNIKGKNVTFTQPKLVRTSYSLLTAISNKKVIHSEIHKGSINRYKFLQFTKKVNKRTNRKWLLMDNASVHRTIILKKHMKNKSNKIIYNVPYNPETNPIEQTFSKIKYFVTKENTQSETLLIKAINNAIKTITPNDFKNYYKNSFFKKYQS